MGFYNLGMKAKCPEWLKNKADVITSIDKFISVAPALENETVLKIASELSEIKACLKRQYGSSREYIRAEQNFINALKKFETPETALLWIDVLKRNMSKTEARRNAERY